MWDLKYDWEWYSLSLSPRGALFIQSLAAVPRDVECTFSKINGHCVANRGGNCALIIWVRIEAMYFSCQHDIRILWLACTIGQVVTRQSWLYCGTWGLVTNSQSHRVSWWPSSLLEHNDHVLFEMFSCSVFLPGWKVSCSTKRLSNFWQVHDR